MPRTCTICTHRERAAIDEALVIGAPFRTIAERFGTSAPSLHRHKADHLPPTLARAHAAEEVADADSLLAQVRFLQTRALAILGTAETAGDLRSALGAIREARANLELLAKLVGELDERPTVNVLLDPAWLQLRQTILGALAPFPPARAAVAAELMHVEAAHGSRG